ncbi:dipeptidase PepE [Echinimonas agarilytica]|uniref:Dipeptidase PepE n=1 Tax=Echinimonas agarilytica TaxID=1215918 RepID=A0AA41W9C9_9GAMM|nr:dipeptidase PepE [Echinimonas agarilytica]MCM2681136.1 dipeptidase PepE [Echinimonas agarilytica]
MNTQRTLLLSASRTGNSAYLAHALPMIEQLIDADCRKILFVPYAGVTINNREYSHMVQRALSPLGIEVQGIHEFDKPDQAVFDADAIFVGGGNTFRLLERLYALQLLEPIRIRVAEGMPYVGWSAGSNVAGPTICTTNDMPIIQPPSLTSLGLVPFQLNPHYTEWTQSDHNGETRLQRLTEYLALTPSQKVLAMPEGNALRIDGDKAQVIGDPKSFWITAGGIKTEIESYRPFDL